MRRATASSCSSRTRTTSAVRVRNAAGSPNFVVVLHSDGTTGEYFHLERGSVQVRAGDRVARGQWLARSGNTGFSTVPHLHFGCLSNGARSNDRVVGRSLSDAPRCSGRAAQRRTLPEFRRLTRFRPAVHCRCASVRLGILPPTTGEPTAAYASFQLPCRSADVVFLCCCGRSTRRLLAADAAGEPANSVPVAAAPPVPNPAAPRLAALETRHLELAPNQEVVGETQVIFARYENTFSAIGRQYNLGYEEMRRANPGVDQWLPGEGTPIYLPTQSILPEAPRNGIVVNVPAMRLYYFATEKPKEAGAPEVLKVSSHPIGIGVQGWAHAVRRSQGHTEGQRSGLVRAGFDSQGARGARRPAAERRAGRAR